MPLCGGGMEIKMKTRKLIAALAATVMIPTAVWGEASFTVEPIDYTTDTVKINGRTDAKTMENVMLIVAVPGVDLDKISDDADKIKYQWENAADKDGKFSFEFIMNSNENDVSGYYDVYVKSKSMETPIKSSFYFATEQDRKNCIKEINENDAEYIAPKLSEYVKILGMESFEAFSGADKGDMAKGLKKKAPFKETDYEAVQDCIKESAVLSCWNNSKTEYLADEKYNLKNAEFIGMSTLLQDKKSTLFNIYNDMLNLTGKQNVVKSLEGKNFASYSDILNGFIESVILNGISNTDLMGGEHISDILTAENAAAAGINIDNYLAKTEYRNQVNNALLKIGTFAGLKELTDAIDKALKDAQNPGTPGSTNNGGGGSKGGGSTGPAASAAADANKPKEVVFYDVTGTHWAKEAVEALNEKGIISGFPDKTFRPDDKLTREQAVKIVCEAFGTVQSDAEISFSDVEASAWFAPYIKRAVSRGVINGISEDCFGVGKNITRQDIAVVIWRMMGKPENSEKPGFSDAEEIRDYAKSAVGYMNEKGYIKGYPDNTFRPENPVTRAEAAAIIYNCVKGASK